MSKCSPSDLKLSDPGSPGLPNIIPGFGVSISPNVKINPNINLDGYSPPNLDDLTKLVDLILPGGSLKQPYNLKIDESVFDAIVKYLDKAYPYLMYYKLILPILEMILCVIEVVCALPNPFKTIRAVRKLFRQCIPNFLSLFPIFALPLFLISLLLLLLALIEYILVQLEKIISLLIKNILSARNAIEKKDAVSYKAIMQKIAWSLCSFQNLFVVLSIFKSIIDVVKEILSRAFNIPACDDGDNDSCCSPDVCPAFFKNQDISSSSGAIQYLSEIKRNTDTSSAPPFFANLPSNFFTSSIRKSSIQFFDVLLPTEKQFINIVRPYDLSYEKTFFPKDVTYTKDTPPEQAVYTVDLRLFYKPAEYGRHDLAGNRFVRINKCIVTKEPTDQLDTYNNQQLQVSGGVLRLVGGKVFEDDGKTPITLDGAQATIDNFISKPAVEYFGYQLPDISDAINYSDVSYTLNINHDLLSMKYGLITAGCSPELAADKASVSAATGNIPVKTQDLANAPLPNPGETVDEINTALSTFRGNVSVEGANLLRDTVKTSLEKLKSDALNALEHIILLSCDTYKSNLSLDTDIQFTTLPIKVRAEILESNGQSVTSGLPPSVAASVAKKIVASATFGSVDEFQYDGSRYFYANLSSSDAGEGSVTITFDGNVISNLSIPTDLTKPISISPKSSEYKFIFASPIDSSSSVDSENRRDSSDAANDIVNGSDVAINSEGV